ncbi:polysaccharide pyruvyl transferase family protein [Pseudooceanicola algae]|uniref:Polysaccharide pyruvyl transferase domain-containing protein n=1 Tax=Pseudooceanicola algae TaxID=1537215 RepID=A0A418SD68_9RHOB|nr:polysaccharide pyruvyl transferase family protein [Pseudooceanicola algae]QPM92548.1 hypothetical protein PSAL_038120 [Pseudooceanicola algae]
MSGQRAYFNIKTQFDNVGDALIIRELIRLASDRAMTEVYLERAPESFRRTLDIAGRPNVEVHDKGGFGALILNMLGARLRGIRCYYFLIPGGLNGDKSVKQFASGLVSLAVIALLALVGVRICQTGFSIERIGPRHARLLRWRSKVLYCVGIRDRISQAYAEDLGIRTTHLVTDLALNLFAENPTVAPDPRGAIGFSFRTDKDPAIRDRLTGLAEEVCARTAPGTRFRCIAQVGRDLPYMSELAERLEKRHPGQVDLVDAHEDISAAIAAYEPCQALLSNRLHGLLLGLRAGASPVALVVEELDHKIRGVFESIGLGDHVCDLASSSATDLDPLMTPLRFDGTAPAGRLKALFDELLGPKAQGE